MMNRFLSTIVAVSFLASSYTLPASAQTTQADQIQALMKQIADLQTQISNLQKQRQESVTKLIEALNIGSRGDNVKILQSILAADSDVYPEGLITGHYGPLTAKAVKRFQKKMGVSASGVVGPKTLEKINEKLEEHPVAMEHSDEGMRPCAIVPPGHLIAPGWLRKHGGVRPVVPPCQTLPPGIAKKLGGTGTSTPPPPPPAPDTTAPIISALATSNTTATSTKVTWTTNEPATSKVWYATSTPVSISPHTPRSMMSDLVTSHMVKITALSASTTYRYLVTSSDAVSNAATSSEQAFTTF